jgi:hypothetical protein
VGGVGLEVTRLNGPGLLLTSVSLFFMCCRDYPLSPSWLFMSRSFRCYHRFSLRAFHGSIKQFGIVPSRPGVTRTPKMPRTLLHGSWCATGSAFPTEDSESLQHFGLMPVQSLPKPKPPGRAILAHTARPHIVVKPRPKPAAKTITSMFDSRIYRKKVWPLVYTDGRKDYLYSAGCGRPRWSGQCRKGVVPQPLPK